MFRKLVSVVTDVLSPPAGPPVEPGIGQRIQAREQEAARERMLAQARGRAALHLYDGPTR